jgi:hypothetical protein
MTHVTRRHARLPASARALVGLAAGLVPAAAFAHAAERMVVLTLPTGRYIVGAAAAVALTGVLGLLSPRLPRFCPRLVLERRRLLPEGLPSWLSCLAFLALVATGFVGSRDPLANPLTLTLWTLVWVGLSLACLFLGDLWRPISPWTAAVRAARRRLGRTRGIGLARLGAWPAALGYLLFAWFEIVSLSPTDPAVLARTALAYWLAILALAVLEGEDWLDRGEAFTLYFAFVSRIAPLWTETTGERVRHMAGLPGAQILSLPPLPPSAAAFVALVLAAVSFDGLSDTFRWLAFIGVNPLEFPGRSAVVVPNTLGLVAAWPLTAVLVLGAMALGRRLAGRTTPFRDDAGRWFLSFLPIAAGYHAAHYLVALLTDGQHALAALDDPLGRDASLLGLPHHWVSFGFLSDRAGVTAVWTAQVALILGAHVLAVLLAFRLAADARPVAHLPMTALMVAYTVFGLWLLSAPTGA